MFEEPIKRTDFKDIQGCLSILDNMNHAAYIKDIKGRYLAANEHYLDLLKISLNDLLYKIDRKIYPETQAKINHFSDMKVIESGRCNCQIEEITFPDNTSARLTITRSPLVDARHHLAGILCILKTSNNVIPFDNYDPQELLEATINSKNLAVSVIDKDYNLKYINPAMQERFNQDDIPRDQKCYSFFQCQNAPCDGCTAKKAIETKEASFSTIKRTINDKDNWYEIFCMPIFSASNDSVVGVIEYIQDITHQKTMELSFQKEHNLLVSLLDNLPFHVYIKDRNSKFVLVNHAFCLEHNISTPSFIYGKDDTYLFPDYEAQTFLEEEKNIIETGIPIMFKNKEYNDKNGNRKWCLVSKLPLKNNNNQIIGILGFTQDNTQDHLQREKMQEMQLTLQQMEKMDSISKLASGISHDFNNQLSAILGCAELIVDSEDLKEARELGDMITISAKAATDLTKKLLSFTYKDNIKHNTKVNINDIIDETIGIFEKNINKNINIIKNFNAVDSYCYINHSMIENVLLNLTLNCRDAMPDGGTMTITTGNCQSPETGILVPKKAKSCLCISISDNGMGIPPEIITRIFEPFYTTKPKGSGTGMGLASVYNTIKNHKGAITIESTPGQGTTFNIFLPLAKGKEAIKEQKVKTKATFFSKQLNILIIDDDTIVRRTVSTMLNHNNCETILAESGEDGVEKYRENKDTIDLVLLDMIMPKLSGLEVFSILKEINPDVKVLIITGYSNKGDVQLLLKDGAKGVLQKPFDMKKLLHAVADSVS